MQIKKVKLLKPLGLEIHYSERIMNGPDRHYIERTASATAPPHLEFYEALAELDAFLAELCEQSVEANELTRKVECTGFTIGGAEEHEGVTLIGRRTLKNNRVLNLVSPFRKWDDPNSEPLVSGDLGNAVEQVKWEAIEYLKGKYQPSAQGDLFEQEDALDEELEAYGHD